MTSAINTGAIDPSFPVPGVNNNSQGFRTNFGSIQQNLNTAATEITDIQSKAILKSALTGTSLNNDMANALISNALVLGFRRTTFNLGNNVSGDVTVDTTLGDIQYATITGDTSLQFAKWAPAGTQHSIEVILTVVPGQIIQLPTNVTLGTTTIENYTGTGVGGLITVPANTTQLHYVFTTVDCGTNVEIIPTDRPRVSTQVQVRTPTAIGLPGDRIGAMAFDGGVFWLCSGNYDGATSIWAPVAGGGGGAVTSSAIINGSSNVTVNANSNVTISSSGNANIITVTGTGANIAGYANISANLTVAGRANVTGNLAAGNITTASITSTGNVGISLNTTVGGTLTVSGNASIGNIVSSGTLAITGNSTLGNITSSGTTGLTALTANANVAFTGANVSLGDVGNLHITGGTTGQVLSTDGAGNLSWTTGTGGAGTPGGSNSQIQFNNSGNFAGSANLTWAPNTLTVTGNGIFTGYANVGTNLNVVGNVNAANTVLSGLLNASGNITGGNLLTGGVLMATGNISGANIGTGGLINATGNITGGNLITGGQLIVSSGANITGNFRVVGSTSYTYLGNTDISYASIGNLRITGNVTANVINAAAINTTGTGPVTITSSSTINLNAAGNITSNANVQLTSGKYLTANLVMNSASAPISNTANGVPGQIVFDSSYVYVCVGVNTWKRAALTW